MLSNAESLSWYLTASPASTKKDACVDFVYEVSPKEVGHQVEMQFEALDNKYADTSIGVRQINLGI
jgi:hypothetical protein